VSDEALIILDQAATFGEPSKAAFDNPAMRLHHKSFLTAQGADNFEMKLAVRPQGLDPRHQFSRITRVGPDFDQSAQRENGLAQHRFGTIAILHVGGRNLQGQQPTVGVAEQMAFAALEFFVGVVAAGASLTGSLYRLAVEDRRRGSGFFLMRRRASSRKRSAIQSQIPWRVHRRR
jgi:hypothetical protein